ncbi:unnamed protein product [Linum trigynum]|uniref:Uncharacterized protein n=1 Tax=Linum trigynum TaxID=586398 RepID=A0AAV2DAQ6_9ROSI
MVSFPPSMAASAKMVVPRSISTTFRSPPLVDRSSSALFRLLPLSSSNPRGGRNQAHRQTSNSKRPAAGLQKRRSSGSASE